MLFATRNRLQEAFSRWRANTSVNHVTKEYHRYKQSTFLESVLNKLIKKRHHDGFHAIHKFLREKEADKFKIAAKLMMYNMDSLRHYFSTWAANTHKNTTQLKSSSIQNFFYIVKDVQFNNAKVIFDAAEEHRKKQSTIKLLVSQLENLKKNAFYIWAARVSRGKIQQELNWRKRLQIADVLVLRLDFMYRNQLRAVFSRIFTESKEKKLMIRAIISMQKSVFDQVKAAFLTWRNYKNSLRHENARKVAFMLRNYAEKNIRLAFQSIKDEWRRKQFIMRRTILKIESSSTSNTKFYFYKWMKAVETMKSLEKFQGALGFFAVVNEAMKPTVSALLDTQYIREQKEQTFKKLLMATNIRLREVFRLWHSRAKGLTAYNKLREDLKGQMLERLRVLHARFSGDALRYYMNKWKDSCKENRLVKRVVFRMLQTHFGLKYMAFNTWKAKASKKMILKTNAAMQLEQALKHLYRKNLQWGFDPLANEWYRAVDMKVQTVKSLMFISQGSLRRSFKIWATNVENLKHIEACRSVILLMNTINEGFRNHIASWMSVDSVAKVQKEKTVRIIMGNMDNNLLEAFRTWKAFTREKALEEAKVVENTKAMLLKLSLLERRLSRNYVKECFEELKYNVQVHKTKKRVLLGLLKTNFGLLHDYFNRWKNLPKPEDPRKQMGVGTVSFQLIKLYERAIKHGFDALKSVWHEKNEAKRACVRRILYMTQSSQKRLFDHWKAATIFARNAERCRETLNFFEVVKYSLNSNIAAALEPDTKKSFKIKMFNRLKDETTLLLRITLKTWRESVWQMKAEENVQNQRILVSFIRLIKWLEKKRIEAQKEAFGAMLEHKQHLNHAKRIALALYKTRMGQLLSAWQKWKSIPGPDKNALKASSFALAKVLHALCQKTLKDAFENIKEEWIEANEIKKDAVRKMIWLTNGLTKDAFDRWASHARTAKSMKVYGAAQKLFSLSALVLERSLKDMRKGIIMSAPKRASTHKIVKYFIGLNLRPWFQRWYFASKIHKADTKVKIPNLARIIERLRLVALKEVFEMLKTRNSTLKLKRFVAIFRKYDEMHKKEAIESIKQHYYLQKQKKLMFAVNNIIRYNRLFTQSSLYTFFSAWRQWSRDYNPWFKRAINLVSKNSRINTQIAFWRLRDSIKVKGSHLNTAKSEKTNKIFLILKKKYEQTLTRAFWQIETYGKMHNTSLSIPGENLEEVKKSRASGGTQKPISLETSFDSSFLSKSKFEKQKQLILKLLVRNYTLQVQNTRERLKEYFKRWTLHTSKAPKAVFESLNSKMNENELVHLARLGTIEMLKEKLENAVARMKMDAFELLLKHAGKERKKLLNLMESPSDNIHSSPSSNVNASGSISIEKQSPEGKNYTLPEFQPDNLHVGSEKVIPEDTPDFRTQGENSPN